MERMLVVVFNDEPKAYEGTHALKQLDTDGSIAIHAEAVIKKNADGTVTVKQSDDDFPIRTVGGTAIGSLIGLLEGPVGLAVGATAGLLAGSIGDLAVAGVEALGGTVFRKARKNFVEEQWASDVATLRTEIDQLKAEHARARGERKAKLQAKIDKLNAKLEAKLDQAKQRAEQIKSETNAKVQALQKKAEKAQGEIKATFDTRVKRIRGEYEQSQTRLKHLLAGQLKEAAARLEK